MKKYGNEGQRGLVREGEREGEGEEWREREKEIKKREKRHLHFHQSFLSFQLFSSFSLSSPSTLPKEISVISR